MFRVSRFGKSAVLAATCFVSTTLASSDFSFTGSFTTDDQLQEFSLNLAAPATITAVTFSYAGGTDQAANVIPAGGFDPWLSIFDSSGNLLASVDNGSGVPADPVTGASFDSLISQVLAAGPYTLILSQSDNQPVDTSLSDGFTRTGQPDFTAMFGCSNGVFCDVNADNRTPNWEVDIDNVTSASQTGAAAPEPGTMILSAAAIAGLLLFRRSKKNA
jgi:PEP-CTERM motif-containing protein